MEIKNVKINGVKNPVGFYLNDLILSYYIDGVPQGELCLKMYDAPDRKNTLYIQKLDYSENFATKIQFVPKKETAYFFEIHCGKYQSGLYYFETGTDFDAPFIKSSKGIDHPVIFRNFCAKNVVRARLYVTGLGIYEATLNGMRVGNEYLTPYCNDYNAYLQYQTYDITPLLAEKNCVEIALGDGWYKGRFGLNHCRNIYGEDYICAAKIVLWGEDGKKEIIRTDETWSARPSKVVSSGIYDGEIVDATRNTDETDKTVLVEKTFPVTERISLPVIIKEEIKPTLIISPKGEKILDFGQNFSGFVSFRCRMERGQTIRLQAGEVLQEGCFYRDNLRSAKAEFVYTSDGINQEVYPKFTFFGFRYMRVDGSEHIDPADFTGKVLYSDLDETAFAATDNAKIDRLLLNCKWGQKSNFIDVPTDCPQRDERLGWTGDAEVFCSAACYQFDCRAFYAKYCRDMAIDQKKLNGGIASYSPSFGELEESGNIWSDAATIIPWTVYEFYGDKYLLASQLPLMRAYVDRLIRKDDENGGKRLYRFGFCLGDWLSQDGINSSALRGGTNEHFIASCYYYNSVKILSLAERELGYEEQAEYYSRIAEDIRNAILREYFTSTGRLAVDTQTAYVICIMFEIWQDRERLVYGFKNRMKKDAYKIKGGFVGATKLIQALIRAELTEEAFRILFSEKFPSWLYCVNLGATTIWERWNSLNADGTISGTEMNSLNHYSFGAVAEAVYRDIAGIIPKSVAFKKVVISPKFNYRMKKFDCYLITAAGEFKLRYNIEGDGRIRLNIFIPYGVDAVFEVSQTRTELAAGNNVIDLPADSELVYPFSIDSKLCDILNDEKCRTVFRELVPGIGSFLINNDVGMAGYTLRSLLAIRSFFVPSQTLALLDKKLKEISV